MGKPLHSVGLLAAIGALALLAASAPTFARELTIEQRVEHQRAIEQVYWNHRVWPKENPAPKPPLSAVIPDAALRAKVEGYLKKSNALAKHWQRPVTSEQLQAEMDRMARDTKDGATLLELFHALNDDAYVIAETLSRQTLVDRLIHDWYAADTRFHGEVKAKAEAALASCHRVDCMESMGGGYQQMRFKLGGERTEPVMAEPGDPPVSLDAEEWQDQLEALAKRFRVTTESLPTNRLSGLEETSDAFVVTAIVAQGDREITTASVVWPKPSFGSWWAAEARTIGSAIAPVSGSFAAPSVPSTTCTNDTWSVKGMDVPDARVDHTAVWTGTEMIVWGGLNSGQAGGVMNSGGRYDPSAEAWIFTSRGASVPGPRTGHTAVWTGAEMIVWGGGVGGVSFTGGRYTPSTDTWIATSTGANVAYARRFHTAVWTGTEMIVWGGTQAGSPEILFNAGGRYNPLTDWWTYTSTGANVPSARRQHTAVWTGTEMIVWGGVSSTSSLNSGGRYRPSTDSWIPTTTNPGVPAARSFHTAVWTGTEMIVWGGTSGSDLNTGGRYNPTTNTWTPTSIGANVPAVRRFHTALWSGTEMIVWGGRSSANTNTGGRYNPSTDSWAETSTGANVPEARNRHAAVWTGTEMIVWGGEGLRYLSTGGRYNPSTNSWTPTKFIPNLPGARSNHTAVWTGAEMIVWGGDEVGVSTGGRYNPSTGTWSATSTDPDVPSDRSDHTAVWTGMEMIVWGSGDWPGTGGRYNPSTDTWRETSTVGVPSNRDQHTVVWTGTEMIVWGGEDGQFFNTGGRYNPSTDTWTATSTGANVPSVRYDASAVWSGTEMIVWGGTNGLLLNSGGRYNPTTNTWTATSTGANVPSARDDHTAVWTGMEMVVWGGDGGGNTGGRYNPSTNTWTATSTAANVPSARSEHTAVWTGTEMIVWGGGGTVTGGRYNPVTDAWTPTSMGPNVPPPRNEHGTVWTGTEMIVWGGRFPYTALGGSYCACPNGTFAYRDADGDGFGNAEDTAATCDGVPPLGYVANSSDCNDADPSAWAVPGAASGMTVARSLQGEGFTDVGWQSLAGEAGPAVRYDIVAGSLSLVSGFVRFTDATCLGSEIDGTSATVSRPEPAPETGDWFLVRARNACGIGTYDENNPAQNGGSRDAQIVYSSSRCAP